MLLEAGGIDPEPLRAKHRIDGHSLVPLFKDPSNNHRGYTRDTFIWHYPFIDLRRKLLGPGRAIRPAAGDPRLEALLRK